MTSSKTKISKKRKKMKTPVAKAPPPTIVDPDYAALIVGSIGKLVRKKGRDSAVTFVVSKEKGYWIQIIKGYQTTSGDWSEGSDESLGFSGEAVCNKYLVGHWRLSDEQEGQLINLGWEYPEHDDANYFCYWEEQEDGSVPSALVEQLIHTMTQVYGLQPGHRLDTEFDAIW